jgi:hypothetical protein
MCEMKGLDGSKPPLSAMQSSIFAILWRDELNRPAFGASWLPKVTGESGIGGLVGRLDEFLSAPQRFGVLRGPVKKLGLLHRSSPAVQASKNVRAAFNSGGAATISGTILGTEE